MLAVYLELSKVQILPGLAEEISLGFKDVVNITHNINITIILAGVILINGYING